MIGRTNGFDATQNTTVSGQDLDRNRPSASDYIGRYRVSDDYADIGRQAVTVRFLNI